MNHLYLSDHVNYVFSRIHIVLVIVLWHLSKTTPRVALEVEQPGIAQVSLGISNLITEVIPIRNLTSVRFYSLWFSRKKVCLHLLHVEKEWVEFSVVHKLFHKNGQFGLISQTIFPFLMTMPKETISYLFFFFFFCINMKRSHQSIIFYLYVPPIAFVFFLHSQILASSILSHILSCWYLPTSKWH